MRRIRAVWRNFFDIRPGGYVRTLSMSLYLLLVLFAYYILKPVSRALFLNKFDIDKLPWLYILIAGAGGILAYVYTKTAVKTSLQAAVTGATGITIACLVTIWWLIGLGQSWVFYLFNIWVSLFSVVLVSQGWLVAANVFNAREAKRLYGLLGMGAVLGAAFGGKFTAISVQYIGTRHLLLASAGMVFLAYLAFRVVARQPGVSLASAPGAEKEEADVSLPEIFGNIGRHRHLQVITAIMTLTFIVDVMIEYQFNVMAKQRFRGDELTAFLGNFYGPYLSILTVVLQLFLTSFIVSRIGVGGTLQIMPVTVCLASLTIFFAPSVYSAGAVRLTEAATRYTLNRTAMELLYLPLPADLKNRTKAFIDVFVDRMARGLGGMLLLLLTTVLAFKTRQIALVTVCFALGWILLSHKAGREYVATVRKRLTSRRLDLESARVNVEDPATLALLEQTALSDNARQASYALSLLAEVTGYDLTSLLRKLADHPSPEVRGKVYELARISRFPELPDKAMREIDHHTAEAAPAIKPAVAYLLALAPEERQLAGDFLHHSNALVAEGAIEALASSPETARDMISPGWLSQAGEDENTERRALAALAVSVVGDRGTELLQKLLNDPDPSVVGAACRSAGVLQNHAYVYAIASKLGNPRLRGAALTALIAYGPRVCGTLGDLLVDENVPVAVRRQIPRVLKSIPQQRSVEELVRALEQKDLSIRGAVLKALNSLRERAPHLTWSDTPVSQQILTEARYYFELNAALAPFRDRKQGMAACGLLARTIEERLNQTLERLFRLLGLRYPPKEIYSAYLAVNRQRSEELAAALEFLDSILDRELKRIFIPLLDAPDHVTEAGRHLFGVEVKTAENAVRDLIHSRDPWLVACSMAAAAELKLASLAPDISEAAGWAGADVREVAHTALQALA